MFYERDMKLGEIIKFTGEVIKRNKKIYINMFLIYAVWGALTSSVNVLMPNMGLFNSFVTIVMYIISFCIFLGLRKIIYYSLYDENYSEDFDKESIIEFVKGRWFQAFVATVVVWLVGSFLTGLIISVPLSIVIFNWFEGGFSFGAVLSLIFIAVVLYMFVVIFMYYILEINLNNDIKMVNAEVISVLKIKKSQSMLSVLPLGLFNILLYIIWFFILFGIGYMLGYGVVGSTGTTVTNIIILLVTIAGVMLLSLINLYMQTLWITKYYNMKNAIVYEINGGKNNTKNVEDYKEIEDVVTSVEQNNDSTEENNDSTEENSDSAEENNDGAKQNNDYENNVVGESSMWGSSTSIEDSIIGIDEKKD